MAATLGLCTLPAVAQQQDSTAADSVLLDQIRQEMQDENEDEPTSGSQASTSNANIRNPEISAIGDFRSHYTGGDGRNWDAFVQGVELNFSSAIDPYAKAEFYPVFEGESGELNAKIEEAYVQTLSLPYNLQLKAGKFRQAFGRINTVHRHALPVIDVPIAYENFFGEALIDQGVSLSWLIPNPNFYQELIVEATRGPDESPLFGFDENEDTPQFLAHLKNFWDLTDNATLQLGFSGAIGKNDTPRTSKVGGVDITYKWSPIRRNTYKSFEWQTEFYFSNVELPQDDDISAMGMYSWAQYQLSKRWFVTGLYSYSENPNLRDFDEQALSATFGWYATEFQKMEIGPKISTQNGFDDQTFSALFRWVFVIGSHGAHQY